MIYPFDNQTQKQSGQINKKQQPTNTTDTEGTEGTEDTEDTEDTPDNELLIGFILMGELSDKEYIRLMKIIDSFDKKEKEYFYRLLDILEEAYELTFYNKLIMKKLQTETNVLETLSKKLREPKLKKPVVNEVLKLFNYPNNLNQIEKNEIIDYFKQIISEILAVKSGGGKYSDYQHIFDPKTREKVSIGSNHGLKIVRSYIEKLMNQMDQKS